MTQQRTFPENVTTATPERDALGKLLFTLPVSDRAADTAPEIMDRCDEAADAILSAGYFKPRVITTAEELDALPVGSVVRTSGDEDRFDPRIAVKTGFWMNESEWEVADADDFCLDSGELDDLPATVLYEPEARP